MSGMMQRNGQNVMSTNRSINHSIINQSQRLVVSKQEVAELCQAQPAEYKLFGPNGAIFWLFRIVELLNCCIVDSLNVELLIL